MSTQSKPTALGSRENFWWECRRPIDEFLEKKVSDLNKPELRRVIRHEIEFNLDLETMSEAELRSYLRDLRVNDQGAERAVTHYERARWKAHHELRKRADKLSKTAKHASPCRPGGRLQVCFAWLESGIEPTYPFEPFESDTLLDHDPLATHPERTEVELTDPVLHVPRETPEQWGSREFGQYRFRRRFDPEHGYIGGVTFRDLPFAEFMDLVENVIADLDVRYGFRREKIEGWLAGARSMKRDSDRSDEDVLTDVLLRVFIHNS